MKLKPLKRAPVLLALAVLAGVCGLRLAHFDFFERLEDMTYDLRVRVASRFPAPAATNLAFVAINEDTLRAVRNGSVGFHFSLFWPRQVYGRLVDELSDEGAKAVAFDVLFSGLRPEDPLVQMADGGYEESDRYFADQLRRAGNVILADSSDVFLPALFVTNALALGDITTERDPDGVLRRVKAFRDYRLWNPFLIRFADLPDPERPDISLDLTRARVVSTNIIVPQTGGTSTVTIPVDAQTNFAIADFSDKLPPGGPAKAKAFTVQRVWQLGIVLAAQQLHLDLAHANVDLAHGKITLHGPHGLVRVIPVDHEGYFYVDWRLKLNDPRLLEAPVVNLLWQYFNRLKGDTNGLRDPFRGKLVIVGSTAEGSGLADRGATPLARDTFLVSKHWNIANSVITGRFVRRASLPVDLALIVLLGALAAWLTWQLRAFVAAGAVLALAAVYTGITLFAFIRYGYWLPLVFPVAGAALMEHVLLIAYRVMFEEGEKRRVKSVFARMLSPEVVNELLGMEKLSLGGGRREITVYFADVRGFTEFTDQSQTKVLEYIRDRNLSGAEAEAAVNEEARETLNTVNLYLGTIANVIKRHDGTLDKYIGDCVMAFWGAPVPNARHAAACVRAAIDTQRAIYELNLKRLEENQKHELENATAGAAVPKPRLPILTLGSGINTGMVTVGLMGSDVHGLNYTAFGREVNLASRLESRSGSARIIISEATYRRLRQDDPELAATCITLPPLTDIKGIRGAVNIYEVPWRPPGASPFNEEGLSAKPTQATTFTGVVKGESH